MEVAPAWRVQQRGREASEETPATATLLLK